MADEPRSLSPSSKIHIPHWSFAGKGVFSRDWAGPLQEVEGKILEGFKCYRDGRVVGLSSFIAVSRHWGAGFICSSSLHHAGFPTAIFIIRSMFIYHAGSHIRLWDLLARGGAFGCLRGCDESCGEVASNIRLGSESESRHAGLIPHTYSCLQRLNRT